MKKAYLDCNILLDWLLDREPFSTDAARIISITESKAMKSFVSPLTLANTWYLLHRATNRKIAEAFLLDALNLFQIVDVTEKATRQAVVNRFRDFEDDLHYFATLDAGLDCIITRNQADFPEDNIEILDAGGFIKKYGLDVSG
jgi:predicted nucleic acid-binding protein